MSGRIILLAGCAGSGKSTRARNVFPTARVVSADHYFEDLALRTGQTFESVWDLRGLGAAHSLCQQRFMEALMEGHPFVIVDNTNVRASERQRFVKAGLAYGYEVEIHVLSPWAHGAPPCSPDQVASYLSKCHGRNVHGVPLQVITQQFRNLDLPAGAYRAGKPPEFLRHLEDSITDWPIPEPH